MTDKLKRIYIRFTEREQHYLSDKTFLFIAELLSI